MELDHNKTPPPPYVCCPFTYEHKDQLILKLASAEQLAEHCKNLHQKYADSTKTAIVSFIRLPIPDMTHHILHSLATEYQLGSPYQHILTSSLLSSIHSPPTPSS